MSISIRGLSKLSNDERWDPEFYDVKFQHIQDVLNVHDAIPLSSFVENASRGVGPTYDSAGSVRVINSVNVRQLELSDVRQSRVKSSELKANPNARVEQGDIVITSTGIGTMGRAFCNLSSNVFFADGHITVLRLKDRSLAPYLCGFLQSPIGRAQFVQRRRGSSRQVEIYPEDILSILIPPFTKQRASIASDWLACVKDFNEALKFYPEAETTLLTALGWKNISSIKSKNNFAVKISELQRHIRFDPEYYSPRHSKLESILSQSSVRFESLTERYVKGVQPAKYALDGDTIVIKSKDVLRSGVNLQACERAHSKDLDGNSGLVLGGMLAINMTGVGTLGRASVVPPEKNRTVLSVDVSGWQITNELPPEYISLFLNSPAGMAQSLRMQIGSSGQLHLYPEHIRRLLIYVKKTKTGLIEKSWHQHLADKVIRSASARMSANERLQAIFARFAKDLNLNPVILRE